MIFARIAAGIIGYTLFIMLIGALADGYESVSTLEYWKRVFLFELWTGGTIFLVIIVLALLGFAFGWEP